MAERKITPQERYAAKYKKQFKLDCFTSTEMDIIEKLESVPNKAGYIKSLIRADIAASNNKTATIGDSTDEALQNTYLE